MALELPPNLPKTAAPRCRHFGVCGGCALQDVDYAEQVRAKERALRALLGADVSVVPSPSPYSYRFKMEFVVGFGKIGLRAPGSRKHVVDLHECHLVERRVSDLLGDLHRWMSQFDIPGYDYLRHRGDLRYVATRHALSSDQLMVTLVTASRQTRTGPLLEQLGERAESVVWMVNSTRTDLAQGQVQEVRGLEHIRQRVGPYEFLLGPDSFFQNNLLLVDGLFEEIAAHVRGLTMDLFCGVGAIGLYGSSGASRILGVEAASQSVELARRNAALNGVAHAEYAVGEANAFLRTYDGPVPDTVVVDPPRRGLAPGLIRKLLRLGPGRIVYVSCNPRTFSADLARLANYRIVRLRGFDMFPQTPHVEIVAVLDRVAYPPLHNQP